MANDAALPSFSSPPVAEVAIGAQFENLHALDARHIGAIAATFADRLPGFAAHPPLNAQLERFDGLPLGLPFNFALISPPVFPRLWFLISVGTQFVQVQRDRLMQNWRRMSPTTTYPRYEQLREEFVADWRALERIASDVHGDKLQPTQCEVMYVNPIEPEGPPSSCAYPSDIFAFLAPAALSGADAAFAGARTTGARTGPRAIVDERRS